MGEGWSRHHELLRTIRALDQRIADDPGTYALVQQYLSQPDAHLGEWLEWRMDQIATGAEADGGDPFFASFPSESDLDVREPHIAAGRTPSGQPLPIRISALARGVGFFGPTGTAKSTLGRSWGLQLLQAPVEADVGATIVFDPKGTWRKIAALPALQGHLCLISLRDLAVNLLQPPEGVPDREWRSTFVQVFAQACRIHSAQRLLTQRLESLPTPDRHQGFPPFSRLVEAVECFKPGRGQREATYRESILNAMRPLEQIGIDLECTRSNALERLFARRRLIIIDTGGCSGDHLCFITSLIAQWLFLRRRHDSNQRQRLATLIFEDATAMFSQQRSRETPGGVTGIDYIASVCREMNICLWLIAHEIDKISPALLSNLENIVAFSPRRDRTDVIQQVINCSREQAEAIKLYPCGRAAGHFPSTWPTAVPLLFDPLPEHGPIEETLAPGTQQLKREFIVDHASETVASAAAPSGDSAAPAKAPPPGPGPTKTPASPSELEQRFLKWLLAMPPMMLTDLYGKLQLSRREGVRFIESAEKRGWVKRHALAAGRGGSLTILEPLAPATALAKSLGINSPDYPTHGDWLHNVGAIAVAERAHHNGSRVTFEAPLGSHRVDVRVTNAKGRRFHCQIGVSSPERETEAAGRMLPLLKSTDQLLIVCRDAKFRKAVQRGLKQISDAAKGVQTPLLGKILKENLKNQQQAAHEAASEPHA